MEDKSYKSALDDAKETVKKEMQDVKKQEDVKKTQEYVESLHQTGNNTSPSSYSEDDADNALQGAIKSVVADENLDQSHNSNDKITEDIAS